MMIVFGLLISQLVYSCYTQSLTESATNTRVSLNGESPQGNLGLAANVQQGGDVQQGAAGESIFLLGINIL